jgi:hypothetical protein
MVGTPEGKKLLGRPRSVRIILKLILDKQGEVACTGFIWLRIGTSGGLLLTW